MRTLSLQLGDVLYREGDPSDQVYFIESGMVEVRRSLDGDDVVVATLGKGEILGEMGIIRECPRSTTILAAGDVRLVALDRNTFLTAFGGKNGLGLKLLRMICERLCTTTDNAQAPVPPDQALRQSIGDIRLLPGSPETKALLGRSGILIDYLPFEIGLSRSGEIEREKGRIGLPLRMSRQLGNRHLRIELAPHGGLVVCDLESKLGSLINGKRISAFERFELGPTAPLRMGDNEIVAGGIYSPVRFILRLRKPGVAANAA